MKQQPTVQWRSSERANDELTQTHPANAPRSWRQKLISDPEAGLFVVAACLVCLGYTLYTDQIWEDSLIALRHSENLLKGDGLTYNPGELVQGVSSPISILLLTICRFLTSQSSYVATFWLYRAFTIPAFAASGVLLLKAVSNTSPRWAPAIWFLAIFYLFDDKTVAFATNGMESAFMLLFVAWGAYLLTRSGSKLSLWRGLCWGGLMWTRPDGCVYIAALSFAELIFLSKSRRSTLVSLLKSAAICLAVYAPWAIWAWSYYGSPIPHTIVAKVDIERGPLGQLGHAMDKFLSALIAQSAQAFRPIYYNEMPDWFGVAGARLINGLTEFVGVVSLLYWSYPVRDRFGRATSLCFAILCSYFVYMTRAFPWYFPPVTLLGATAFARAATLLACTAREQRLKSPGLWLRKTLVEAMLVVLAAGKIFLFGPECLVQRAFQMEIEMGNRAVIGEWLKQKVNPGENVYLEPIGYIGYFSGARIDDFPGLISPEVVRIRRQIPSDKLSVNVARVLVIPQLKPDWVVLRDQEYFILSRLDIFEDFQKNYVRSHVFDVNETLNRYRFLPAKSFLRFDSSFVVFRRTSSGN